jgi:hypothetical protein
MAMGTGMPDMLPPTIQDGNYVDIRLSGITAFGDVLSPGPGECSIIQTALTQDRGEFVQSSVTTYDFSKITGVRYLGLDDDFLKAPSREPDDPEVDTISLDGEAWQCQRVIHVDPANPTWGRNGSFRGGEAMPGGAAPGFASDRRIFLGSHPGVQASA